MRPDVINAPALQEKINEFLEGCPPTLKDYLPTLRVCLRKALERHDCIRKAHKRKNDPTWAKEKFDNGRTLYRFDPERLDDWEVEAVLDDLEKMAALVAVGGPASDEAKAFLRGLRHQKLDLDQISGHAHTLNERSEYLALQARRDEQLRPAKSFTSFPLVGHRCESIREIIRLGREAKNCLADEKEYWEKFAAELIDIWHIRDGNRLVAILEVKRAQNRVVEAYGPSNMAIRIQEVRHVALFCAEVGFNIGPNCSGLLPDYTAPFLVEPKLVEVGKQIAIYAEWPTAVRIELSAPSARGLRRVGRRAETLTLSFDPDQPCGTAAFGESDPRREISAFGRKEVRKIVRAVALTQVAPTLVQHRLLALAV